MSNRRLSPAMIKQELGDLPWMSLVQGSRLTDFIKTHELEKILQFVKPEKGLGTFIEHRNLMFKINA